MSYDVYYTTGGGSLVYGGSDVWVNNWLKEIAPKLNYPSKLLIHRIKPNNNVTFDSPIEVVWDNGIEFENTIKNCRKLHILHGYYSPNRHIIENKDKLESVCLHVCIDLSLRAKQQLGLRKSMHFASSREWENDVSSWAKKVIWIGINKTPLHDKFDIINIPNYYEFNQNKNIVMSNIVGFASRMENRKSPHFLENIDSMAFTDIKDFKWWKENMGVTFNKTKLYQFNYKNIDWFYKSDKWGISHSCHLNEPFGYSIFQGIDYGKLPILQTDWCGEYNYPFRASNKEEFDNQVINISDLYEDERQNYLDKLREYLKKYDNKKDWISKFLDIYN